MEKIETIYEKGSGFLRDVFQYFFPGIIFLFSGTIVFVIYYLTTEGTWKTSVVSFLKNNLPDNLQISGSILFVFSLVFLIIGYFLGLIFMEFGDCLNRWTKVKGKEETFRDEMKVVVLSPSPVIPASYIERYNLLFYLKRNIGFSFFCLAVCSVVSCIFLRPRLYFMYVTLVSACLGFIFAWFARTTYKDFLKRLESALELLEQGEKK